MKALSHPALAAPVVQGSSDMIFGLHLCRERDRDGPMHPSIFSPFGWKIDSKCGRLWSDITQRGAIRGAAVRRTVLDENSKQLPSAPSLRHRQRANQSSDCLPRQTSLRLQGLTYIYSGHFGLCTCKAPPSLYSVLAVGGCRDVSPCPVVPVPLTGLHCRALLAFSAPYRNMHHSIPSHTCTTWALQSRIRASLLAECIIRFGLIGRWICHLYPIPMPAAICPPQKHRTPC